MCGLAGILGLGASDRRLLLAMAASIAHRGPDDEGIWADPTAGIGFAHRRLAIVDLSPMGHQPMHSSDGRFTLAYNGEIYNHLSLRKRLDTERQIAWRGQSDTETLVEAIAAWGLRAALEQCVGMFALAVWDHGKRRLMLARDRFGEKPLYYGWVGGDFLFASELKAIRLHPRFKNGVDRRAVRLLAARAYIPTPFSIHERIFKLEPGCILSATPDAARHPTDAPPTAGTAAPGVTIARYWSYRDQVIAGLASPIGSEADAVDLLEESLSDAIAGQSVADVTVGAFLSGGIDSSVITALYQAHSPGRVRTFTIGFEDSAFDESPYAERLASILGTYHHHRLVTITDAQAVIPLLPAIYDEPFADSSQIATYLVSKFAREQVTVALSGDGGDELFGGYNRYLTTARLWSAIKRWPRPLRAAAGGAMGTIPPAVWKMILAAIPGPERQAHFGTRLQQMFQALRTASNLDDVVASFLDEWTSSRSPVLPLSPLPREVAFDLSLPVSAPDATCMMLNDSTSYLPDDILCKVDRSAMAVSLETRVPFLDHRVASMAARIPISMNIDGGKGKHVLRKLLYRHVPEAMFDRPKAGFAVPVGQWLRGDLRDWAEDLLAPANLAASGYFDPAVVGPRWADHLSGRRESTEAIWSVLMFHAWLRAQTAGQDAIG